MIARKTQYFLGVTKEETSELAGDCNIDHKSIDPLHKQTEAVMAIEKLAGEMHEKYDKMAFMHFWHGFMSHPLEYSSALSYFCTNPSLPHSGTPPTLPRLRVSKGSEGTPTHFASQHSFEVTYMNAINEPCLFPCFRHVDESGIGGTNHVLDGAILHTCKLVVCWQ